MTVTTPRWAALSAAFLVAVLLLASGPLALAQPVAVGRSHAQKAARFADQGKCGRAIVEFNKAYEILKDPAILFNRAECHRNVGHNEDALADYQRFLVDLPKTPNRTKVEARIDELRAKLPVPPGHAAAPTPAAALTPAPPAPAPILDDTEDEPAVIPAAGIADKGPSWVPPEETFSALPLGRDEEALKEEESGVSGWVWVGLGAAVVAAGVVAGVLILGKKDTEIRESTLGNYKF